jgi:hypothetical protein
MRILSGSVTMATSSLSKMFGPLRRARRQSPAAASEPCGDRERTGLEV